MRHVSRLAFVLSIFVLPGCGQGPSQQSVRIDRDYDGGGGRVYALPKGVVGVSVSSASNKITVGEPKISLLPDPDARFLAVWNEEAFSDDHFTFETDEKGLLKSNNAINDDKTGDIIGKVVELAKESLVAGTKILPFDGIASGPTEPKPSICSKDFQFTALIDPFSRRSKSSLDQCFDVQIVGLDGKPLKAVTPQEIGEKADGCSSAVCLRLPTPILIRIKGKNELKAVAAEFIATVPDPNTLVRYDLLRGPCIKREHDLTFSSGMLTKADLQKPSEILACLSIPVSIAKTIGEIPGSLVTARVNVITSEQSAVKAQADYAASMSQLIKNQTELARLASGQQ